MIYPVEIALALLGTAAGFLIAIGLFHAAGPRRARQISQVLAAGIAGAFILGVQIAAILPAATRDWLIATAHQARAGVSSLGGPALDWMAGALMQGDAAAIATFLALSAAVFAAAVIALSGAFSQASQLAAGAAGSAQVTASRPYREGVAPSLRRKEWRLLLRDPNLFAQLSLQIIYTLPVVVFLLRGSNDIAPALALAPFIVVLATQISASLAWLTVSGEDAPELIQSAPVGGFEASLAKLTAIGAPVALILAAPLIALFALSPQAAVYTALCSGLAGCSAALLNFWHPMAGNRRGLLRRHSQSKIVALAEHGLAILWALAVVFAMVDWRVVAIPALGILLILWLFKPQPVRLPFLRGRRPVAVVQM